MARCSISADHVEVCEEECGKNGGREERRRQSGVFMWASVLWDSPRFPISRGCDIFDVLDLYTLHIGDLPHGSNSTSTSLLKPSLEEKCLKKY